MATASALLPRRRVVLLGATGSIGENTLRVIAAHRDRLELVGIAAHGRHERLAEIAQQFGVRQVGLFDADAHAAAMRSGGFPVGTQLHRGPEGLRELATLPEADTVLVAVVGTAGLQPTLDAIAARKTIALASKEILVLAGKFVMAAARASGSRLLPVDSEHNAAFQCLESRDPATVRRLVLTASGGAFRDRPLADLAKVTPADALQHPNWAMGPKITVDSATMANKGLELIEAQWLFGLKPGQCDAVLHPQSIVHCVAEFTDGSMLAQLCPPSMTFPIQHALLYPGRAPAPTEAALPLNQALALDFRPVETERYPMLGLARQAMAAGGAAPAIYNAANEVAVADFLKCKITFLEIPRVVEHTLGALPSADPADLATVMALDAEARRVAAAWTA
jgi:1-deoxy-D-xylulose-5-phosphate reductoisomerase